MNREEYIKAIEQELAFFRQIDWIRLGKRLELDLKYDGTGWENLALSWRTSNEAGVLSHLFKAFNKGATYTELLDRKIVPKGDEVLTVLDLLSAAHRYVYDDEAWESMKYRDISEDFITIPKKEYEALCRNQKGDHE